MNILYFCQLYPPAIYGGGEYIFFQWAKELVRRGHKVFTITQRLRGEGDFEIIDGINVYRVAPAIEFRGTLPAGVFKNLAYITGAIAKGMMIIAQNKIDIIHSNTYAPAFAGQLCAIISRKPHIITVHDVYYLISKDFWDKWASQASFGILTAKVGLFMEKLILKLPAKVFHTVSEASRQDLCKCGLQKVIIIPNGVDLRDYDLISAGKVNAPQVIFVGRLVFFKNLDTVIRAMRNVVARIPDAKLIVVGDGPMLSPMRKLVERFGLVRNVVFKGRISHEEKVRLLKQSSFLVLPSLVEGFGIVLLEAFACRKPVLVSAVRPLTDIVDDGVDGYFVSPFDIDMWASKMLELFDNFYIAEEMGISGRRKLEQKYTIQKNVDALERLYSKFIKGK
jgi:glycosyltransferase involved in cell wall biosynthesis